MKREKFMWRGFIETRMVVIVRVGYRHRRRVQAVHLMDFHPNDFVCRLDTLGIIRISSTLVLFAICM